MEIKLHQPPDKPTYSCQVIVFCQSKIDYEIKYVSNVGYSAKYGMFNTYDYMHGDEVAESQELNESVVAWAYMDEVVKEVMHECLITK